MRAYNLAVHGGGPQASYLLLRRSLDSGARPRALVVDFPLESLMADHLTTHMGDWPELATVRDCAELAWIARDADLFATTMLARALPSFHDRLDIRANLLAALRGEECFARKALPVLWRNWNRNACGARHAPEPRLPGQPGRAHLLAALPRLMALLADQCDLPQEVPEARRVPAASPSSG